MALEIRLEAVAQCFTLFLILLLEPILIILFKNLEKKAFTAFTRPASILKGFLQYSHHHHSSCLFLLASLDDDNLVSLFIATTARSYLANKYTKARVVI